MKKKYKKQFNYYWNHKDEISQRRKEKREKDKQAIIELKDIYKRIEKILA